MLPHFSCFHIPATIASKCSQEMSVTVEFDPEETYMGSAKNRATKVEIVALIQAAAAPVDAVKAVVVYVPPPGPSLT